MKYDRSLLFILMFTPLATFAVPSAGTYWICKSHDKDHVEWTAKSEYRKIALNSSLAACKKRSTFPATCRTSHEDCEGYHLGLSIKPFWRCTALDRTAAYWRSNYYPHKDDAILAAKAYCKSKSSVPETCYVNVITCSNINENN